MNTTVSIPKIKAKPPQKGSVTHHQDQLIKPVNLRTTKATPKRPTTPIPELEELLELLIFVIYLVKINFPF